MNQEIVIHQIEDSLQIICVTNQYSKCLYEAVKQSYQQSCISDLCFKTSSVDKLHPIGLTH